LLLAIALLAAPLIIVLTARRPVVGCALLAIGVPLTTALGRDTVIPVLRPNEAILVLVLAGLALHHLRVRRAFSYIGVDVAISIFAVGCALIPWLVLLLSRADMDFDTWRAVLGPLQFLAIYLCFAQLELSDRQLTWLLNLTLLVSVVVGAIAFIELQDFPPGIRDSLLTVIPPNHAPTIYDVVYRPTSTLGVYGAVGAFAALNFILALILANRRGSRLRDAWLSGVIVVNLASVVASLTWAPAAALLLGAGVVMWYARRVPRQIWIGAGAALVALVVLWPAVSSRIADQQLSWGNIQTLDQRMTNWQIYFLPVLHEHIWFGTGTVIPGDLPTKLADFVDNEFLRIGFRAGVIGVGLLIAMLSVVGLNAWSSRDSVDPWRRVLGAVALATVVTIVLTGFTAEYLNFGGLSQYIAMIFGLLAARIRYSPQSPLPLAQVSRTEVFTYAMARP